MNKSKAGATFAFVGAVIAVIALAGFIAFGGSNSTQPDPVAADAPATALTGPPAPTGQFEFLEGGTGTLADFQGRPVVVNFFADWCPACVVELPDFQAVHEEFGEDVVFLGLDRSTSNDGARALLAKTGVSYDVALDRDGAFFLAFEGFAMPTTVFISADGRIVDRHNGVIFEADLRERIEGLIPEA